MSEMSHFRKVFNTPFILIGCVAMILPINLVIKVRLWDLLSLICIERL